VELQSGQRSGLPSGGRHPTSGIVALRLTFVCSSDRPALFQDHLGSLAKGICSAALTGARYNSEYLVITTPLGPQQDTPSTGYHVRQGHSDQEMLQMEEVVVCRACQSDAWAPS
jgi:hypothetical protein